MSVGTIDADFLEETLADFNCKYEGEEEFVDKVNALGRSMHMNNDDLVDELMAFATNEKKSVLDMNTLENFQQYYLKKKAKEEVAVSAKKRVVLEEFKPTPNRSIRYDEDNIMDTSQAELPLCDGIDTPKHLTDFAPFQNKVGSGWFLNRKDSGKIVAKHYGSQTNDSKATGNVDVTVVRGARMEEKRLYGADKAAKVVEGFNSRLDEYISAVRESNAEAFGDTPFVSLNQAGEEEVFVCGHVRLEMEGSSRSDISSFLLVAEEEEGPAAVTVDASRLEERCFFPGQMLVMRGVNKGGHLFEATQVFSAYSDSGKCTFAPPATVHQINDDAVVWVASGPFTPPSTASYEPLAQLVFRALSDKPNALILVGPLVDRKNSFVTMSAECTATEQQIAESIIQRLVHSFEGSSTKVYIVPSSARDSLTIPAFPRADLLIDHRILTARNSPVEIVTDPCTLSVGGVEITVTASEVLHHLSSTECYASSNKENVDRLGRIAGHLLEQRSLYPLHPPSLSASLEGIHTECTLARPPHVIAAPCVIGPFVKVAYGCIVANPGPLCRGPSVGAILKLRLALSAIPSEGASQNISDFIRAEVIRI